MRDSMYLGSTPYGEDCAQVGSPDYAERGRKECRAFIAQLKRQFGEPPDGCRLTVKSEPHDFGSYYSVFAVYDCMDKEATAYAFRCENNQPELWDADARQELGLQEV